MATGIQGGYTVSVPGTVTNNPANNAVLVDSGALVETGFYEVRVVVSSDATAAVTSRARLEYRNFDNSSTKQSYSFYFGAYAPVEFLFRLPINTLNERLRVAADAAIVGDIVCHINVNKIGG